MTMRKNWRVDLGIAPYDALNKKYLVHSYGVFFCLCSYYLHAGSYERLISMPSALYSTSSMSFGSMRLRFLTTMPSP